MKIIKLYLIFFNREQKYTLPTLKDMYMLLSNWIYLAIVEALLQSTFQPDGVVHSFDR